LGRRGAGADRMREERRLRVRHQEGRGGLLRAEGRVRLPGRARRAWTLSTIQVDMAAPTRFELAYIGRDGQEHRPAMLHRAILGSLERFIAIYLEHTAGDFPLWLAPLQAIVLPITERHADYAAKVGAALRTAGLRAECDARNEKLNFKIREAELQKIPLMLVVGDQEVANGTVALRRRHGTKGAAESVALDRVRVGALGRSGRAARVDLVPNGGNPHPIPQAWRAAAYQGRHPDQRAHSCPRDPRRRRGRNPARRDDAFSTPSSEPWKRASIWSRWRPAPIRRVSHHGLREVQVRAEEEAGRQQAEGARGDDEGSEITAAHRRARPRLQV